MQQCQDARDILGDNTMKALHDLAKEDLKTGEEEAERLEKEIHILLIPKDPNDNRNAILEIRQEPAGRKRLCLQLICLKCILSLQNAGAGRLLLQMPVKPIWGI